MKKETLLALIFAVLLISGSVYFTHYGNAAINEEVSGRKEDLKVDPKDNIPEQKTDEDMAGFIQCLKEAGVVIYGSKTCPACKALEDMYGGYEMIKPIYLDCSGLSGEEDAERCSEEMQTIYVPEIQINGELIEDRRSPECLSEITGCEL